MERAAQWHGVDHDGCSVGKIQPHDLEEVAGLIRSDRRHARGVDAGFQIHDDEGVIDRVVDGVVFDAVLVSGTVDIHTRSSEYEAATRSGGSSVPCTAVMWTDRSTR